VNTGSSIPAGTCYVSSCNSAYFNFDGAYSNGCECVQDAWDLNNLSGNSSGDPHGVGDLLDNSAKTVQVTANLLSKTNGSDSDWYKFHGVDGPDNVACGGGNTGDNFHVRVRFTNNPAGFLFNVWVDTGSSFASASNVCSGVSDWSDRYDFISGNAGTGITGECPCTFSDGVTDKNQCSTQSKHYWVEVFRPGGAFGCDNYTLEMSNGVF
jgi:hypothetical protein